MKRREFLHAMGAAGAAAALSPLSAISLQDDWYVNARLGLSLRKPPGWHFVSVADFEKLMDKQQLELDDDAPLLSRLRELSGAPILTVNKYDPIPDDDIVCPTIQVYANPPDPEFVSPLTEAYRGYRALGHLHREYALEAPISLIQLGGLDAATWNYTYRLGESEGMLVKARYYVVYGTLAHYSIGMAGPANGVDLSEAEFASVRASMTIE